MASNPATTPVSDIKTAPANNQKTLAVEQHPTRTKGVLERMHKYLLLLAILAATVTYNAGLSPPGGVWAEDGNNHRAGDPVLQEHYDSRYNVFFYCNATAFVASLVIIMLLLSNSFSFHGYRLRALQTAMVLDLLGLMGAFTAGSCRKAKTSAYVVALVGAIVAYLVIHTLVHFCIKSNRFPSDHWEILELLNLHRSFGSCFRRKKNGAAPMPAPAPAQDEQKGEAAV